MHEWPRKPVRELCTLIVDCVNRTAPVVERTTPYRMIRTTNVRDGRIDLSECRCVEEATFERWTRRAKVLDGDVILTREAPIGEVGFASGLGSVFLGQRIMQFRPDPSKIEPRYLYYAFRSPDLKHQFGMHDGSGSVVSHIRVADCHEFKVSAPPLAQQKLVVELLGSIDDKIELNRRMNETLEAMAQAIFRDWFVDFGPVRRKLAGATDPVEIMGGLTPDPAHAAELASLFPDAMGDDEFPMGWRLMSLFDVADQCKGTVNPQAQPDTLFEHYSLPAHDTGQEPARDLGVSIKSNKVPVPSGAVLVSKLNPEILRVWAPTEYAGLPQVASTEFLVFTPKPVAGRGLLYFLFRDPIVRQIMEGMVTGTSKSHQRISPPALLQTKLVVGAPVAFAAFEDLADPILRRSLALRAESRTLAETRDYLLPRLMSGEVRVGDVAPDIGA